MPGRRIAPDFLVTQRPLCPEVLSVCVMTRQTTYLLLNSLLPPDAQRRIRMRAMRLSRGQGRGQDQ